MKKATMRALHLCVNVQIIQWFMSRITTLPI